MRINETADIIGTSTSISKKGIWLLLPFYHRVLICLTLAFTGLHLVSLLQMIVEGLLAGLPFDKPTKFALDWPAVLFIPCFLGSLFLWMGKKTAIRWGCACAISAIFILIEYRDTSLFTRKTYFAGPILIMLYLNLIYVFGKVSNSWAAESNALQ